MIALAYALLAIVLLLVDRRLGLDRRFADSDAWVFGGGADGTRGVLLAIAGTMITVISVVFSLTIVVLQIASAQFTPRVLRLFTGDRGTQVVLGVFLGTFAYALIVLRAIRGPGDNGGDAFVPVTATATAIVLAIVSIGFMVYSISHIARAIQVAVIIERVMADTIDLIDEEEAAAGGGAAPARGWREPTGPPAVIATRQAGYLQAIDAAALREAAARAGLTLRTEPVVGAFVLPGAALASAWPAAAVDPEVDTAVRAAFVLGPERTRQQDAELGVRQLADIAIKALSPAVNDPTTATICLDRLAQILLRAQDWSNGELLPGANGSLVRLRTPTFARLADIAFTQIRRYGSAAPVLAEHLAATLGSLVVRVPAPAQAALGDHGRALGRDAEASLTVPSNRERVARALAWVEASHSG